MEDYSLLVAGLEYKVRQLIEQKNTYFAELQKMKDKFTDLQTANAELKKQLQEITGQKQILELAAAVDGAKDPGKLKLKINEYIREIDRCIAYLNIES